MPTSTRQDKPLDSTSATAEKQNLQEKMADKSLTLWTVLEAAFFLRISPGTLFHWVSQKKIPCIRFGARCLRFDPEQTKQWAAQHVQNESAQDRRTI